jgi:hypothetical protein
MMRPRQAALYWKLWSRVCVVQGWDHSDRDKRLAVHQRALGHPKSSKQLNNGDLDKIFPVMRLLCNPTDLDARMAVDANDAGTDPGERRRLEYVIGRMSSTIDALLESPPDAYLRSITVDMWNCIRWRELPLDALKTLRNVLHNRLGHFIAEVQAGRIPNRLRWPERTPSEAIIARISSRDTGPQKSRVYRLHLT